MLNTLFIDSLLLGVQHSFEPDHMAAISVLATEKKNFKIRLQRLVWRSAQWALGHAVSLLLFSMLALIIKSLIPFTISYVAEMIVGPIMIWLGISAIQRNFRPSKKSFRLSTLPAMQAHSFHIGHIHGSKGQEISLQPFSKSFWVGMLHGVAGTGGACAMALMLASDNHKVALGVIALQSLGILIAMTSYSCVLAYSVSRFVRKNHWFSGIVNGVVGVFSIGIGLYWILKLF